MSTNGSKSLRDAVAERLHTIPPSGIRDFFDIVSSMRDVISLGIGEPDFVTPWRIRESSIFALERGATSYTSNLGLLPLREKLARYVKRNFGGDYDPEHEVLVTVGVSEALDLALRAIINPGDEVLYHEPCYVSYGPAVTLAHGVPVPVTTRGEHDFRLRVEDLEAKVTSKTKALMLNYPNNPTGAGLMEEDVSAIAAFAERHDLIIITDEIYAELTYDGKHHSILSAPGTQERTIFLHGFSKAWAMTGFRLGYACAPVPLIEAMTKIHQYTMLCAPILSQKAGIEALRQADEDVGEMRTAYEQRRNFVLASFKEMGLSCPHPRGAFYAFPQIGDLGLSSKDFALRLLDEERVAVVPGSAFGACGEGHVRCAYATSMHELEEAMLRLARFVENLRK